MRARAGFFTGAYELRDNGNVDEITLARVNSTLDWFRENLAIPPKFNRSNSKGDYRRDNTRGLSWFKPTATDHIKKAFELASILTEHGYFVETLRTSRPGYIVYEDEFQVVAEPFSDSEKS